MFVDNLERLAVVLDGMKPGFRVNLERVGFRSLWPRPEYPAADDYLTDEERAAQWCRQFGCTIRESYDPRGLLVEKPSPVAAVTGRLDGGYEDRGAWLGSNPGDLSWTRAHFIRER